MITMKTAATALFALVKGECPNCDDPHKKIIGKNNALFAIAEQMALRNELLKKQIDQD